MEQKKQEQSRNIQKIKDQINSLNQGLAFEPQTAHNYKLYIENLNILTEQLANAQSQYDLLFTPEELVIRDLRIKAARQQQRLEEETKYRKHQEELRIKQEESSRLCRLNEEKRRKEEMECNGRMKSQIDKDNKSYIESISSNIENKDFLNKELSNLETWWDELTQYGQPCNAAYLLQVYNSKKEILKKLITNL